MQIIWCAHEATRYLMKKLLFIFLLLSSPQASSNWFTDLFVKECSDTKPHTQWHDCVGTYVYSEPLTRTYVGEWMHGKRHGQGTLTFASGNKYVGEFKDGKRHGYGTYSFVNGNKYIGEFSEDLFSGQGTMTYTGGDKYVGEWKNGVANGQGTYTFEDGTVQSGIWVNGEHIIG